MDVKSRKRNGLHQVFAYLEGVERQRDELKSELESLRSKYGVKDFECGEGGSKMMITTKLQVTRTVSIALDQDAVLHGVWKHLELDDNDRIVSVSFSSTMDAGRGSVLPLEDVLLVVVIETTTVDPAREAAG